MPPGINSQWHNLGYQGYRPDLCDMYAKEFGIFIYQYLCLQLFISTKKKGNFHKKSKRSGNFPDWPSYNTGPVPTLLSPNSTYHLLKAWRVRR